MNMLKADGQVRKHEHVLQEEAGRRVAVSWSREAVLEHSTGFRLRDGLLPYPQQGNPKCCLPPRLSGTVEQGASMPTRTTNGEACVIDLNSEPFKPFHP